VTARARIAAALSLFLAATLLGGCGSRRSIAAYCETFYRQGTELRSQWAAIDKNTNQDPLATLVALFGAPQQLEVFFARLDKVAPDSIEPDVAAVQQSFQQEVDGVGSAASNPFGAVLGGLVSGLANVPSFQAVDTWTEANCGPPPGTKWLNRNGS
jgi:hypothetical protein